MVWPFTTNKRITELENKLNLIETSLRVSFHNIKKDLINITNLKEDQIKNVIRRLAIIESQLFDISEKTQQDEAPGEIIQKTEPLLLQASQKKPIAESLTEVQQNMLTLLAKLNIENPSQWFSAKYLAQELYPEKQYEKIRPMISTYLDVLEEFNLIRKERKRKQVFIKLTDKGISYINPKLQKPIQKEVKIKNKK